jgi:hypothetical protein
MHMPVWWVVLAALLAFIGLVAVVVLLIAVGQALLCRYRHSTPERHARWQAGLRARIERLEYELDDEYGK